MTAPLEELVRTLLYEGYALYPYTPGATKNATPTPFGIVYPPAYAAGSPTTFDRIRLQGIVDGPPHTTLEASVRFLEPAGERHEAIERRVDLAPRPLEALDRVAVAEPFALGDLRGRVAMAAQRFDGGLTRVTIDVRNETDVPGGLDRTGALRHSLLSTHVVAAVACAGAPARFVSLIDPPEHAAAAAFATASVNTFPVLATAADDVLLGAAIILPDHPQIAPESRGDLFDATEIEEALLLHLLALSDGERREIAAQDPAVRAMLDRAVRTAPEGIVALHGRVTVRDPVPAEADADVRGEETIEVGGITYRRGAAVRLRGSRSGFGQSPQDHLLDGRTARIERIYVDYDDHVHLGVTVDDDPGQDLMRDIGRYLYFKPTEVEVIGP